MNDLEKARKLFEEAFKAGAMSERFGWDADQMSQITASTCLHDLMVILNSAHPPMQFDGFGDLYSVTPISINW